MADGDDISEVLSTFCAHDEAALRNDRTHPFLSGLRGNIWQSNHFSITTFSTNDYTTNGASCKCIVLCWFYILGNKCIPGTYDCHECNNFVESDWYEHIRTNISYDLSYPSILHAGYWSGISSGTTGTS